MLDKNRRRQPWPQRGHLLCQQPRLPTVHARLKAERRRLKADVMRRPKADVIKVRAGLIDEWPH